MGNILDLILDEITEIHKELVELNKTFKELGGEKMVEGETVKEEKTEETSEEKEKETTSEESSEEKPKDE